MYYGRVFVAPTVITHNAQFMRDGKVVVLRGVDVPPDTMPTIVDKLGNVTFVRIRVNWAQIEPTEGTFDTSPDGPIDRLDQRVEAYQAEGIQVLIDFHITSTNPMPDWAEAGTGPDWWTDPNSVDKYWPFVQMMVLRYQAYANVMGFELWNEPQGAPATAAGTDQVIRWQARLIKRIRTIDKQRAIVVMLRGGWDQGLRHAQLQHFGDTHHLVLDFHDQFCGCFANNADGYSPDGESLVKPSADMTNGQLNPYIGTKADQAAHLAYVDRWVNVLHRPVLVGEFEVQADDPNGVAFQDQLTDLMRAKGYSWARWQGPGTWQLAGGSGYGDLNAEGADLAAILAGP